MPTVAVDKRRLFEDGLQDMSMTSDKFTDLCFEYGIELDDETDDDPPQLKIDIPANRYDLLCYEGIALNLGVFLRLQKLPTFALAPPAGGQLHSLTIKPETAQIRPFACAAILRGISFTKERYDSFIQLQEKLHQNIARQRTLVAIGTHDLDTIQGPFTYEALPPEQIKFAPLNQTKVMNGRELMEHYDKDPHIAKYLHIIRDSPVFPIIYDANRTVLSMPPIINSNHSKITLDTKNVFIDVTATDKTKLEIVVNIITTMFSCYCSEPFVIEPVTIHSPHNDQSRQSPDIAPRPIQASAAFLNSMCGLSLSTDDLCANLERMGYVARPDSSDRDNLNVEIPPTRPDILHQADLAEDVAISYGFNKLPVTFPASGQQLFAAALPINKLSDICRHEAAQASWTEALSLVLCAHDENYKWLNQHDDGKSVIKLQNPQTLENQIVRTSLIPGLLKCVRENKHYGGPIRFFEASDVAFKDESKERKARNERHFAAVWYDQSSGFEQAQGLVDKLLRRLQFEFRDLPDKDKMAQQVGEYWLEETDDKMFFPGRGVAVLAARAGKTVALGKLGTLHPSVLKAFELPYPASVLELNLEPLV